MARKSCIVDGRGGDSSASSPATSTEKTICHPLLTSVRKDVEEFLAKQNRLFFNEQDFQMHLAVHLLHTGQYENVDVEYFLPYESLEGYPWIKQNRTGVRLDIVVSKGDEFIPIELKYKTKKASLPLIRFGSSLKGKGDFRVLANQAAQNWGKYDFWKDVRRLELVKKEFNNVKGGLAVFLTNDPSYRNPPQKKDAQSTTYR